MIFIEKVPIWEKSLLTISEATQYFNIGEHKLREITDKGNFNAVVFIGSKKLIKRKEFEKWIESERYL